VLHIGHVFSSVLGAKRASLRNLDSAERVGIGFPQAGLKKTFQRGWAAEEFRLLFNAHCELFRFWQEFRNVYFIFRLEGPRRTDLPRCDYGYKRVRLCEGISFL
jgi:hypothetical protein